MTNPNPEPSNEDLSGIVREAETYLKAMTIIDDERLLVIDPTVTDLVKLVLSVEAFTAATAASLAPVRVLINAGRYAEARTTFDHIMAACTTPGDTE